MTEISSALDIVRPEIEKELADEVVNYFREKTGYDNVPDFMIRDVFKTYLNPQEYMKYECNELMYWWHEMLQNTSNYLLKTVTQNKEGYSFIATKHIIKMLRAEIENNEDFKKMLNDLSGQGGGDGQPQPSDGGDGNGGEGGNSNQPNMDQINQNIQDSMEETVQNASDEIDEKKEAEESLGTGDIAGKGPNEIELISQRMELIKDVMLNKREVGRLITRSIKGFKKGFGSRTIVSEEGLFEADVIEDLIDEHNLFNEVLSLDVHVRDQRTQMTAFDLYIDISGSMTSSIDIYGKSIRRLNMAVALACKMNSMKCLGDIYVFNGSVAKLKSFDQVWNLNATGGTDIEKCMRLIEKNNRPSVILTDGEDGFSTYTNNAFIMSISPYAVSSYFNQPACAKMIKNKKYIQYDGKKLITPTVSKGKR